jgi:hypothetical protein
MLTVMRLFDRSRREVDLFVRYCIPFDNVWADAERRPVGDVMIRVMSLEHLLRAKRQNGRPHDLLDIAALLALHTGYGSSTII